MSEEVNTTPTPGLTLPDDAAPAGQLTADDRLLAFSEGGEPVTATAGQLSDYVQEQIPYVGENLCAVHNFTITTNAGNNQLPPEGFAKQSPLLKSGQTYIISGKRDGEKGGQCMVRDGGVFKVVNFYTPFTPENDVEVIYFRSTQPSSTVVYSDVKIEVGSKATPFIPGIIASVLPMSLSEQLVPGEFWMDVDGVQRQVYQRTFRGTATNPSGYIIVATGAKQMQYISGYVNQNNGIYAMPFNSVHNASTTSNNMIGDYLATTYISGTSITISYSTTGFVIGSPYVITFKYTKA